MKAIDKKNVKLIAHRGLTTDDVENTLQAFVEAGKQPCFYGIETDIQVTKDGTIVCFHDRTGKTALGTDIKISELTYNKLKKTPLYNKNTKLYDKNYTVCDLKKYVKTCKKYKKVCVIEIKSEFTNKQLDTLLTELSGLKYLTKCMFISFHTKALVYLRKKLPNAIIQQLVKSPIARPIHNCEKYNFDVSFHYQLIKKDTIEKYHKHGIDVAVWTVNNFEYAKHLIEEGVDYLTTDFVLWK